MLGFKGEFFYGSRSRNFKLCHLLGAIFFMPLKDLDP